MEIHKHLNNNALQGKFNLCMPISSKFLLVLQKLKLARNHLRLI